MGGTSFGCYAPYGGPAHAQKSVTHVPASCVTHVNALDTCPPVPLAVRRSAPPGGRTAAAAGPAGGSPPPPACSCPAPDPVELQPPRPICCAAGQLNHSQP